jgi:anti-sigma regulatory factor (Ser/Thr protein kinase)
MRYIGRHAQMDFPPKIRLTAGLRQQRSAILDSVTIPGRAQAVSGARSFVTRTLSAAGKTADIDSDAATLLTSELVTNAIQHTASGAPGGTVTIVIIDVARGVLIEVIDDGSASVPIVKGDLFAPDGHGLYLVKQLAAQWGYLRDQAGTTVWFHLSTADTSAETADPDGYPAAGPVDAATAASTPEQIDATSSSPVT